MHGFTNLYIDHTIYGEAKTFLSDVAETGTHVHINSSFRTIKKQGSLNNDNAVTPTKPGKSAHNAGLALDFNLYNYNDPDKGTIPGNNTVTKNNTASPIDVYQYQEIPKVTKQNP